MEEGCGVKKERRREVGKDGWKGGRGKLGGYSWEGLEERWRVRREGGRWGDLIGRLGMPEAK